MTQSASEKALTDLYTHPGHLLRRAHQISASIFHDELGSFVTPIQYAILRILIENPGVDQVSVAGLVAIDTSTAASVAIRLEERKLITRYVDPKNRRQRKLFLTDDGRAILKEGDVANSRLRERLFAAFTDDEAAAFMHLLEKFVRMNNYQSRAPLTVR